MSDKYTKKNNKRSRIYVDPEVQFALARRHALHWLLFMVICFVFIGFLQALIEHPSTSISEMFGYVLKRNFLAIIGGFALIPVFIYDTLRVTNRFAGPITRLRCTMRAIGAGKGVPKLHVRSSDYWSEIAAEFNKCVEVLQKKGAATTAEPDEEFASTC